MPVSTTSLDRRRFLAVSAGAALGATALRDRPVRLRPFRRRQRIGRWRLQQTAASKLAPGTGPRHLAFAPRGDLVFSADELSSTVTCHRYDTETGTLTPGSSVPATTKAVPNQPGGILVSPCGRFVWVTNRGADTVAAFRVVGSALQPIAEAPSGGLWPRALAPAGNHLIVANQHSGTVTALRVHSSGALGAPGAPVPVPSAVCALVL